MKLPALVRFSQQVVYTSLTILGCSQLSLPICRLSAYTLWVGNGSFRPRVISALSRFGPGSFWPGSFRPWVVSDQFGGSFRPIFSQLSGLLPKVNLIHFWLVGECMGRGKAL